MLNEVRFEGFLGRDFEFKNTKNDNQLATSAICQTKFRKSGDEWVENGVIWFDVVCWGKLAEEVSTLGKGSRICAVGRVDMSEWESEGKKYQRLQIVANRVFVVKANFNGDPVKPSNKNKKDDIPF